MNNQILNEEAMKGILENRAVRQHVTRESHLLFFHIYFPEYVKYPIAEFHKDIFRITEDQSNMLACILAFRGSGKSTLITLSYSLWSILGIQEKKFVLIVCQTQSQARQHMANLKHELENNRILRSDLGPFREESGGEWAMSSLVFKNTGARIMIASVDQSVRGIRHKQYRPDLIILDDIEDMNSVRTFEGRDKVSNWFSREIIPLGDLGTRIILVGNLVHEESLLMQLKRRIERKELEGIYHSFPLVDERGKCLWPEKFETPEIIQRLRQSIGNEVAWCMEYLLLPVSDASRVIHPEWIQEYSVLPDKDDEENEYWGAFIGVDLAISEKERADSTAMVAAHVFGYGDDMRIYIEPYPVNKKMDFSTSLDTAELLSKSLAHKGRNALVYVENNGYHDVFVQMLQKRPGMRVEGVPSYSDKRTRLTITSTLVKGERVFFFQKGPEELRMQLTGFGMERHDDLVDAFSLVIGQIMKNNHGRPEMPIYIKGNRPPWPGGDDFHVSRDMKF